MGSTVPTARGVEIVEVSKAKETGIGGQILRSRGTEEGLLPPFSPSPAYEAGIHPWSIGMRDQNKLEHLKAGHGVEDIDAEEHRMTSDVSLILTMRGSCLGFCYRWPVALPAWKVRRHV
jgi:hypothetical protein